jgi:hypothetical protein
MGAPSAHSEREMHHPATPSAVELYILWAQRELVLRRGKDLRGSAGSR